MIQPQLLRRRPSTVEAVRVTEDNAAEAAEWAGGVLLPLRGVGIYTDIGDFTVARIGDWLVRGPFGEFYPTPDKVMFASYEAVL